MKSALPHITAEHTARALHAHYWTEDETHKEDAIRHLAELAGLMGFRLVPKMASATPAPDEVPAIEGAA